MSLFFRRRHAALAQAIQRSVAQLRQNELGFSICRAQNGALIPGPIAEGTPTSVDIPVACPTGTRFVGLFHTHPAGVAYPSDTDWNSGRRVGAEALCILVPDRNDLRCYEVK